EPGPGIGPVPAGRPLGKVEGGSSLGETEADEIAEFDELGLEGVFGLEPVQSLIQSEQILAGLGDGYGVRVECLALHHTAMSGGSLLSGAVNEDASHGLGSGGEEVAAVVPLGAAGGPDQSEVRFVDESGRL